MTENEGATRSTTRRVMGKPSLSSAAITWKAIRRSWRAYALLAPIFAILGVFVYYPPMLGLFRAFYRWRPLTISVFVGLDNFRHYFTHPETPRELMNIVRLLCVGLVTETVVPFVAAKLIFSVRSTVAKELYRLLIVIPMLVPQIVITLVWRQIYDPTLGPINDLLRAWGLDALARNWLGDPALALYAIMFVGFPWVSGIGTLIYLGGLGQISESIYDACDLDGCTGVRRMVLIDLPLILGQVRLLAILSVIHAVAYFQNILILTDGGPGFATTVPGITMYHRAFRSQEFGYASAIGLVLFVVAMAATVAINRTLHPIEEVRR